MDNYFSKNLKYLREKKGLEQQELADMLNVGRSTISCWENGLRSPQMEYVMKLAQYFNVKDDFIFNDLSTAEFDNASFVNIDDNMLKIPVLGTIKAGIPIEAQEDILEYIEIPKSWVKGGKQFYGLRISGDSMFPKYVEDDVVVFEDSRSYNIDSAKNKDCAVMVNGDDATFKKVLINDDSITLVPYNAGAYDVVMYSKDDIINKPVKIIGIAREKRTRV